MKISAKLINSEGRNQVALRTNDNAQELVVPARAGGFGSAVNGGELLFLALATCYCNDLYREAGKRGITVEQVEVEVDGEFAGEGEPARNVTYRARVFADATEQQIRELMHHTDRVAEIHNSLRLGTPVILGEIEAIEV